MSVKSHFAQLSYILATNSNPVRFFLIIEGRQAIRYAMSVCVERIALETDVLC